ncbi:2Fe-2S iron-sulfur cluster-binding protein [Sulfurimonas sp. HSL3-7]|uniref:2Fe-2S iron-sulfur cluster-binding protein n=1 Tax=Sulfonitrofixus jiaomeiensis TaxID=3131938 RepID=UPI0031F83CE1
MINFKINGRPVTAERGETIINVARREDIYIPTMCYIEKTSPCASCRLCSVEVEGHDGFILSCNTPPTEGINVITDSESLKTERTNIMRMYDVNHPLECGVCDKSGACDLQNKTLEFNVGEQYFSAKDQPRKIEQWGLVNYDPTLCILCEKCTHVCNEVIGDDALDILFGGYNSKVIPKNAETLDCTFCGECIAVCPVGALVSSDFQYSANAWELSKIPATCAHCSAGCALEYEVKHAGIDSPGQESIYRVTNNFEYATLCGAGRFGFDFANTGSKDENAFNAAVAALQNAEAIRFSSMITNEEAMILNALKAKLGIKLFNEDARQMQNFMRAYSSVSGKLHYSATLESLKKSDGIILIGSRIATDNPGVRYAMTTAARHNGAKVVYMHPLEDALLQNTVTQFIKYEVGTEEGVLALLAQTLVSDAELSESEKAFMDELDTGYLSAETNVGEDELAMIVKQLMRSRTKTLVVGSDLMAHERAENMARLVAFIEKHSDFSVLVVPTEVNTLGVSLINDLDADEALNNVVGYNAKGDFVISASGEGDLGVPALNQQEGSVVSIDKRLLPTNVALSFEGYTLNDLANALGVNAENTIDYTVTLPAEKGFASVEFDDLENFYSPKGADVRGYALTPINVEANGVIESIEELPEFNGAVIYHVNPVLQFNAFTAKSAQLEKDSALYGSAAFAAAARLSDGDEVEFEVGGEKIHRIFKQDDTLKGTVALHPTFDLGLNMIDSYRFETVNFMRVSN